MLAVLLVPLRAVVALLRVVLRALVSVCPGGIMRGLHGGGANLARAQQEEQGRDGKGKTMLRLDLEGAMVFGFAVAVATMLCVYCVSVFVGPPWRSGNAGGRRGAAGAFPLKGANDQNGEGGLAVALQLLQMDRDLHEKLVKTNAGSLPGAYATALEASLAPRTVSLEATLRGIFEAIESELSSNPVGLQSVRSGKERAASAVAHLQKAVRRDFARTVQAESEMWEEVAQKYRGLLNRVHERLLEAIRGSPAPDLGDLERSHFALHYNGVVDAVVHTAVSESQDEKATAVDLFFAKATQVGSNRSLGAAITRCTKGIGPAAVVKALEASAAGLETADGQQDECDALLHKVMNQGKGSACSEEDVRAIAAAVGMPLAESKDMSCAVVAVLRFWFIGKAETSRVAEVWERGRDRGEVGPLLKTLAKKGGFPSAWLIPTR